MICYDHTKNPLFFVLLFLTVIERNRVSMSCDPFTISRFARNSFRKIGRESETDIQRERERERVRERERGRERERETESERD